MAGEKNAQRKPSPRSAVLNTRPEYERLGKWLRKAREEAGFDQRPLSLQIGKSGQFLNKVEQARQRIDVVDFLDVIRALGVGGEVTLADLVEVISSS